ncbi:MAG: histidine phosphatase family protein [Planctomycetaceae bacterium]|mgnify:FL=1|nr:histidine phosphatase family protein [Planctomycetaceae bacterium]MBT6157050.1 histidine phosphatase family protein [Planctomycetaceae bacterium]MBT6484384.1 histidine phosphatase family protein [Planctomycetaceae bacterium]MBT6498015.1 histidine phosphatase family protein [Planctomycetaceae bacterium]
MKTLLLLRHAKSSWTDATQTDHDRTLNNRGERDAPRMGQLVESEGLVPNCIVSSTAVRARTTAELVAENCGFEGEIQLARELYHAPPAAYFEVLAQLPTSCDIVLAVGHNPGIAELLSQLTGVEDSMPTAALAHIQLDIDIWDQFDRKCDAQLVEFWRPKDLPE